MSQVIINKSSLAKLLSSYMGWSQKDALSFINSCFDWIKTMITTGNRVVLSVFGAFQLNQRKPRRLLHPITQEPIVLSNRLCPQFTPSNSLLSLLNKEGLL